MVSLARRAILLIVLGLCAPAEVGAQAPSEPAVNLPDPGTLKATMLERMVREPPSYRGPGLSRLKWEWWDGVARSYLFEKGVLVSEASASLPYVLRPQWVLRNMKVTFREIFRLDDRDDQKLIPILSFLEMLDGVSSATFEGLTLYGKEAEVKGAVTRKYVVSTMDYPVTWGNASVLREYFRFVSALEYRDARTGKVEIARGNSYDAVNVRWADIKDRVADDLSEEKAAEDRRLLREAYAKNLRATIPDR